MVPFGSYNIGDYFQHWLNVGAKGKHQPKIFFVNFFKKDAQGKFVWPGFGDNARLLKWIAGRLDGSAKGVESPIGLLPDYENNEFDVAGLNMTPAQLHELFKIDKAEWTNEAKQYRAALESFGDRVPKELFQELDQLEARVRAL